MTEWSPGLLVEALVVAPAGAAVLAHLEAEQRREELPFPWSWQSPDSVDENAVAGAVESVSTKSIGELLAAAVSATETLAGPWSSQAPENLALALRHAPARSEIAQAVINRLGDRLDALLDPAAQEWWWFNTRFQAADPLVGRLGGPHQPYKAWVTATSNGMWTVTSPEDELADPLVDVWELFPGPVSRWSVRVDSNARIYEVNRPDDWEHLVTAHPLARSLRPSSSWELPGPNQNGQVDALAAVDGQRAMRTRIHRFVEPDWDAVAEDWDGVHLTWAGFLTTEGLIIDLGDDDVAMLRNWNSERTLWLNAVLSEARPAPAPTLSGRVDDIFGIDARTDAARHEQDLDWLNHLLGS